MRRLAACLIALVTCAGCGAAAPTSPASQSLTPVSAPGSAVAFGGLSEHGAAFTSYTEAGYTLKASGASWTVSTTYGNPRPFVQFLAQGGETVPGQIDVTAGGATFPFRSVDLYASIIPIPYRIQGFRNGAEVFVVAGTVPNTFGNFRTVENPSASTLIDTLRITLTNTGPPCCRNPMGLDNLRFE
jgi:hypothetical protein